MADLVALQAFTEMQERDEAPFFVGRDTYINHIKSACKNALEKTTAGERVTSATRLFYGAPGAGKTSLIREITKRVQQGNFGNISPIVVDFVSEQFLNSEEEVVYQIADALGKDAMFRTTAHSNASLKTAFPVLFGGEASKGQVEAPPKASMLTLKQVIQDIAPSRPILLCVDEIQNIESASNKMISLLHQGKHGLPIIPIYAGLGNALQVLMSHNVSRLVDGYTYSVGALAKEEACEAINTMLTRFEVDCCGSPRDWSTILTERSDCWPQHLHNGMRALALELIRPEVNGVLERVDPETVLVHERRLRMRAYNWRVSDVISDHRELTAQVMHRIATSALTRPAVIETIKGLVDRTPYGLPPNMTIRSFFDHLLHRGLLQEFDQQDDKGNITRVIRCPIPSLATFIMDLGGVDPSTRLPEGSLTPGEKN